MLETPLKLLIVGAHPDDAEFLAGGLAAIYRERGHTVKMLSLTDGSAGHFQRPVAALGAIRRAEAAAAGRVIGASYETWDFPDGELTPALEIRKRVIAEIRTFAPDLLLTHRTNDYHPDHRAAGQLVQDASYLVRVPNVLRDVPALRFDPVVACMADTFSKPCPLVPDVVLDITDRLDTIVAMLACHRSQVFEWLPYADGILDTVPAEESAKRAWLRGWYCNHVRPRAERFRSELVAAYGAERGGAIEAVELYEISEYARQPDEALLQRLFPSARLVNRGTDSKQESG
jgi:LmbE family N-acetylglucosaminyl deacetylase